MPVFLSTYKQVVNDWRRYSTNTDAVALATREARIRKFVILVLVVFYLTGTAAMVVGKIIYATILTLCMYTATIIVFVVSGKNFRREINTRLVLYKMICNSCNF